MRKLYHNFDAEVYRSAVNSGARSGRSFTASWARPCWSPAIIKKKPKIDGRLCCVPALSVRQSVVLPDFFRTKLRFKKNKKKTGRAPVTSDLRPRLTLHLRWPNRVVPWFVVPVTMVDREPDGVASGTGS